MAAWMSIVLLCCMTVPGNNPCLMMFLILLIGVTWKKPGMISKKLVDRAAAIRFGSRKSLGLIVWPLAYMMAMGRFQVA